MALSEEDLREDVAVAQIEFNKADEAREAARANLQAAKDRLAEHICPVKLGDVVVGKSGKRVRVTGIRGSKYGSGYTVYGTLIKKDGTDSKVTGMELHRWDNWRREGDDVAVEK